MAVITHYMFGDESGCFRSQPYFIIGCIKTPNPKRLESDLESICYNHSIPYEIKYCSTNRQTLTARKEFIDLFFATSDVEFRAIVKAKTCHDIGYYRDNHLHIPEHDMAYNHTYAQLLKNNIDPGERVMVLLDEKGRMRQDNLYEYLRTQVPGIADAQPGDSKAVRILQLADLLTGSVFGDLTGNSQPVKSAVQRHALNYLGRGSFAYKISGNKFNLWHWRPR